MSRAETSSSFYTAIRDSRVYDSESEEGSIGDQLLYIYTYNIYIYIYTRGPVILEIEPRGPVS